MKPMQLATALAVLMAVLPAHAQQSSSLPDPLDPGVAVPQPVYESAIVGYSSLPQDSHATPDKNWRQLNDVVANGAGHAAHGSPQAPASAHQQAPAPAPSTPAPATTGHQHH
ncbi:hypothetical protein [Massilia agri]|uniref:Uncharacterized protein n=1 Tax=Massilia agri TaxID=1886785 RepID=A0ABT2AL67_9BURK|nr:hypothetical protein [Massilia agri]MCS0596972.1 hypothetical protein [Massilia agri]